MAKVVTDENFEEVVLNSDIPVIVDFWAEWCGPCRMVAPVIEEIAKEYDGRIKVCKINVDESPNISAQYGIMSIPTLAIFKNGTMVDKVVGALPKEDLESFMQPHIA